VRPPDASPLATIDLNADVGEGYGTWPAPADADLFPLISSASIACGFHAGDPGRMRETAALAARHSLVVGAHPGYPDLLGFGRRELGASSQEVADYVAYQVGAMLACASAAGTRVRYVKPHGALYNRAAREPEIARAVAEGVRAADPALALLGLAGSALVGAAGDAGLRAVTEAFLDRGYQRDGSLVPRGNAGALLADPDVAAARAVRLVREGTVDAVDGTVLHVEAESLCVHGDGARAVAVLRAVRARFATEAIAVAPFIR
jgi:5-oxoprolinase (ATP-hydrolysing) subunit A